MKILFGAIARIQIKVVDHCIPIIIRRRDIDRRREPHGIYAQVSEVIQAPGDGLKGRLAEFIWDDAVDDRLLHPLWIFHIVVRDARLTLSTTK